MADVEKTVEIIFGAVDNTGSALTGIASGIDGFIAKVSGVTGPLADVGNAVLKTEAAIVAMAAAMISASVNEAAKFQEATLGIGTLFNATAEQAGAFGAQIQDFAANSTQSMDSITAAVKVAIGTGVEQAKSLELVAQAEKLAVAGGAELSATTLGLVSALNAYGLSTDQAGQFSDVFFQTVNLGNVSVEQLSTMLANVTSVASAAGVPIETLGASIALLTANGLPAGQAIDGIRDVISNIIKPSSQAADEAARLGIQFDAAALKSKGLDGVLRDVMASTGGNVGQMSLLFGNVNGLTAALALGAGEGAKFDEFLGQMRNSAGATDAAFKLMSESVTLLVQNLQNNLGNAFRDAGKPLLDDFGGIVGGLSEILKAVSFSIKDGAFDAIYQSLETAAAGLTTFLQGVAKALPEALQQVDFSGLADAFGGLADSIGNLFGNLDLTQPEDLAKAIQFVVDSVESLTTVVAGMVASWGPAIGQMVNLVEGFNAQDDGAKKAAGSVLGLAQQFEFFKGVLSTFANGLSAVGTGLEGIAAVMSIRLAGDLLPKLVFGFGSLIGILGQAGLLGAAGAAGYALGTLANEGINGLVSAVTGSKTTLGGWIFDLTHSGEAADGMAGKLDAAKTSVDAIGEAAAKAEAEQRKLEKALNDAGAGADNFVEQAVKVTTSTGEFGEKVFQTQAELDAYLQKLDDGWAAQEKLGQVTADTSDATGEFIRTVSADGTVTYAQNLAKAATSTTQVATETDKAAAAAEKAAAAQQKWNEALAKMAHEEKMAAIKSATEVTVASIEAEAQKAVAAFDSIGESIKSNTDLIGKLFTADLPDWDRFGFVAQDLIKDANQRANEAHKKQMELLSEQIEAMQIRNDRMRDGLAEIVIQADGLEPHIEAFMFQILNKIQVRASQLGAEWLVGGGMVGA